MSGLVCVTGSKGSPGATTLAAALASSVPTESGRVLLIDADPDGGDLAALFGAATNPGLVTLAAATRHRFELDDVERHTQLLGDAVALLAAPPSPEQAAATLTSLGRPFAESLSQSTAVADLGRWRPDSPAAELVRAATATVLVVHPTIAGVAHARTVFEDLSSRCRRVVVATRGERPYRPDEVAAAVGAESAVALPGDRATVSMLVVGRRPRRTPLGRTARALADDLGLFAAAQPGVEVRA
jgi:MinD-like ATPase involved in chromosome partitioning or flagellar assembly